MVDDPSEVDLLVKILSDKGQDIIFDHTDFHRKLEDLYEDGKISIDDVKDELEQRIINNIKDIDLIRQLDPKSKEIDKLGEYNNVMSQQLDSINRGENPFKTIII